MLLVDLDAQGHATAWLAGDELPARSAAHVLKAGRIAEAYGLAVEGRPGLALLPATATLPTIRKPIALASVSAKRVAFGAGQPSPIAPARPNAEAGSGNRLGDAKSSGFREGAAQGGKAVAGIPVGIRTD